jgi:hypothetical protein
MVAWQTPAVLGFCGFYVAKADTKLFNKASQVVLVRDGDRTVMTMANDFKGEPKEFAVVIPVPTFLKREQIHVGEKSLVDHLDAYSAPRLVEYFDSNPCELRRMYEMSAAAPAMMRGQAMDAATRAKSLGVTIEAQYTGRRVRHPDSLGAAELRARELARETTAIGFRRRVRRAGELSETEHAILRREVNLAEQAKLGFSYLRPLQVAYESPKFMLPIRLGMVNANGPQDLFVYALTRKGRVETTNYRTTRLPSDMELPVYLKAQGEFLPRFYKAMFARQVEKEDGRTVFLEYAWDMRWCDPCASDPLSTDELRQLGVFWDDGGGRQAPNVFITRLHVRYDNAHFPEDLVFQETADRANFQGRYIVRHPWTGDASCSEAGEYRAALQQRREQEVGRLASLTGWSLADIRTKAGLSLNGLVQPAAQWWERLWKK